ncbi:hypothetical protein BJ508DRAFT_332252 [Ascobolus immersus RN42]|uniref:Uncharacterized protein n=1 Tax=Ascobolus immersus RN42 TaxID=1160509 RepID=A0A3N4HNH3_ASCIM|nr:hypothetical protein BJ508DRAFT_332252 [Ascobolus immersus RN42]
MESKDFLAFCPECEQNINDISSNNSLFFPHLCHIRIQRGFLYGRESLFVLCRSSDNYFHCPLSDPACSFFTENVHTIYSHCMGFHDLFTRWDRAQNLESKIVRPTGKGPTLVKPEPESKPERAPTALNKEASKSCSSEADTPTSTCSPSVTDSASFIFDKEPPSHLLSDLDYKLSPMMILKKATNAAVLRTAMETMDGRSELDAKAAAQRIEDLLMLHKVAAKALDEVSGL